MKCLYTARSLSLHHALAVCPHQAYFPSVGRRFLYQPHHDASDISARVSRSPYGRRSRSSGRLCNVSSASCPETPVPHRCQSSLIQAQRTASHVLYTVCVFCPFGVECISLYGLRRISHLSYHYSVWQRMPVLRLSQQPSRLWSPPWYRNSASQRHPPAA